MAWAIIGNLAGPTGATGPAGPPATPVSGNTASRPTIHAIGEPYFDTTIGRPIWWNGAAWINAAGAVV